MKLWKKYKIKFSKNKRFKMWTIITLILGIATLISGFIAGLQKDDLDEIDKKIQNNKTDAILESAKKAELNTDCTRFFEEHDSEFKRFSQQFLKGYIVIRQNQENTSCRKTYGDKHYTDFSEFKIYKKGNDFFLYHKYEFANNFFGKNGTFNNVKTDDNKIDMNLLNKPQRMWGFSIGLPNNKKVVNSIVVIRNIEPYVFAFGLNYSDSTISVR